MLENINFSYDMKDKCHICGEEMIYDGRLKSFSCDNGNCYLCGVWIFEDAYNNRYALRAYHESCKKPESKAEIWRSHIRVTLNEIEQERFMQAEQYGINKHDFGMWSLILAKQVGDFSLEVLKLKIDVGTHDQSGKIHNEAIQIAAVAAAIAQHAATGEA